MQMPGWLISSVKKSGLRALRLFFLVANSILNLFSMPTQEIVKKAEDLRTFRGSSSFSGKTHALDQTFQGVRAGFTLGDEQRFNFYMYSL